VSFEREETRPVRRPYLAARRQRLDRHSAVAAADPRYRRFRAEAFHYRRRQSFRRQWWSPCNRVKLIKRLTH
jgi:hypothetical protein